MKLLGCHIENFGKLSDLSLDFHEGINVINEANAWGKSTLAAFLKAMFYGLDAKKDAGAFHLSMWLYVHGIAVMMATNYLDFDEERISNMLTEAFEGMKTRYKSKN